MKLTLGILRLEIAKWLYADTLGGGSPDGWMLAEQDIRDGFEKMAGKCLQVLLTKKPIDLIEFFVDGRAPGAIEAVRADVDDSYQGRVRAWMKKCFGLKTLGDHQSRVQRFVEEAIELAQACDMPEEDAHTLVKYVYGRPVGEQTQEVGGVVLTLAGLCLAFGHSMSDCAEDELERVWVDIDKIRDKQERKPKGSPLPGADE